MNTLPEITLSDCHWDREHNRLIISSDRFTGGFPSQFMVHSSKTGRDMRFVAIGPEDRLYCQDQWDGEQAIYRPMTTLSTVDYAVVTHMY